jgi:hypothetical protein
MTRTRIGSPTPKASLDDVFQRRAAAAAIVAARALISNSDAAIPPATPVSRLSDIELGWLTAATLFAWIKTRTQQAVAEGWDTEETLRLTALQPQPWDAGAVENILPDLAELADIDWEKPLKSWSKKMMTGFLLEAFQLIHKAMIARDIGGGIATKRKSLDEMQRTASAEAGGPLMTPDEMKNEIPF